APISAAVSDADGGLRWTQSRTDEEPRRGVDDPAAVNAATDMRFADELVALTPRVRAFARSLCRDLTEADDLVQSALMKAWAARAQFKAGTNLAAWTSTILMNEFRSARRRARRAHQLDAEAAEDRSPEAPSLTGRLELDELRRAMSLLSREQRVALLVT